MVAWEFGQGRRTVRITPSGPLITSSIELRVAAAVAGAGLIYTFEDVLRPQLEAGVLVPVLEAWWQSFPGPFLATTGDRHVPGPLRAFNRQRPGVPIRLLALHLLVTPPSARRTGCSRMNG